MMRATLRAEARKARYQRTTYGIVLAASALAAVSAVSLIATTQLPRRQQLPMALTDASTMHLVVSSTTGGYVFALVLGILVMTTEFRHGTAIATYLAQPDRRTVMLAKMVVAAALGAILQFVSTALGMIVSGLYVQRYAHAVLPFDAYTRVMAGSVLVGAVLGIMGVAVGSLLRNQVLAIVVSLLWLQLVEGLLVVFADWIGRWSIRGAITSVLDIAVQVRTPQAAIDTSNGLGPWASTLLLLGYAAVLALIALVTSLRRDVA